MECGYGSDFPSSDDIWQIETFLVGLGWLPFPHASLPVVASDTALDRFVAPVVACHDERDEIAAAEAKRAERNDNKYLKQQPAHGEIPGFNGRPVRATIDGR